MKIGIAGGKLQGLEIAYLGKKAGYDVLLIDKNEECPARNLCDEFYCLDIINDRLKAEEVFKSCDIILPAIEDEEVLNVLSEVCSKIDKKFIHDKDAYKVSSSKIKSDKLFERLGVPAPKPYPQCGFPILIKPSDLSGSKGVKIVENEDELKKVDSKSYVIQEYLPGRSYSIEIIGSNHKYRTFQVTEIIVDEIYDCKRVAAYTEISEELKKEFSKIAETLASELNLEGIMDVEVILNDNKLKVLEIDARFPSQTPITVFNSTGENMVEYLSTGKTEKFEKEKGVIFQHVVLKDGLLKCAGEHVMSYQKNLKLVEDFFGSTEAITNFDCDKDEWAATLIIVEETIEEAEKKKEAVIKNIMDGLNILKYEDLSPVIE